MKDDAMQRHLSTGVSTIVAHMAAHRITSSGERPQLTYGSEEVDPIVAYRQLDELLWVLPADHAAHRMVTSETDVNIRPAK
jgi:hypothetical protein